MHIEIEAEACTGHGRCYAVAPDLFEADDEGRGVVLQPDVPAEFEPQARSAVATCPERAVRIG